MWALLSGRKTSLCCYRQLWTRLARQFSRHHLPLAGGVPARLDRSLESHHQNRAQLFSRQQHGGPMNVIGGDTSDISGRKILREMMRHVWPRAQPGIKARVVVALGFLAGAKLINVQVPFFFKHAVDYYNGLPDLTTPEGTILTMGTTLLLGYGAARIGASLFSELRNAVFAKVAQSSTRRVARTTFLHLHSLDLSYHLSRQTGAMSRAMDRGTRGINWVLTALVFNIFPTIFEVGLVTGILAYSCGPAYSLLALSTLAAYATFTFTVTQWRTKFRVRMNKADNESGSKAIDSLINYETVKLFNNEQHEAEQYEKSLIQYEDAALKTTTSLSLLGFGQQFTFGVALTAIMLMASKGITQGSMTVGDLVMVNGLLFQLSIPLNFLGSVYRDIRQALIDMQNMFNLLNLHSSVKELPGAPALILPPDKATVTFENVRFGYSDDKTLFTDLSFTVPAGKKVAIIGGSGSGKSTIVRLLYRFYDPWDGRITVGGEDIKNITLDSLRRSIGVVPQDCVLFHNTIKYNVSYGNLSASDEEVMNAIEIAGLKRAIEGMPLQYETPVGERGLKLSGGEKQRVAIARAVLKNAPILVYDEATSSLDSITEQHILSAMRQITAHDRTSIFIAHRLSSIVDADEILVLGQEGSIIESGSHYHLLSNPHSLYTELWSKQNTAVHHHHHDGVQGTSSTSTMEHT